MNKQIEWTKALATNIGTETARAICTRYANKAIPSASFYKASLDWLVKHRPLPPPKEE
jgi:hypothetical protein